MKKNGQVPEKEKTALILLPSLEKGDGSAAAIINCYDALVYDGWKIDFLLLHDTQNERTEGIQKNGGKIFVLPSESKYSAAVKKMITFIVENGNYVLVHVNIPGHVAYLTLKRAEKAGIPVRIFHCHNPRNNLNLKTRISTYIYDTLCLKWSNRLLSCSESAGRSRFRNRSFTVLKNGIESTIFQYDEEARIILRKRMRMENAVVVGVVGRITAQKNPFFLIDCFEAFRALEPRAMLLWIGEGELEKKVRKKLKEKNLMCVCRFPGRLENVGKWYSAMDIFLLPSIFEGFGIVFLEAQCSGLLCYGSDGVPQEVEVTELMHRIPLKKDADYWAEIMECGFCGIAERRGRSDDLNLAGYTTEKTKNGLLKLYDFWCGA